ncbi:MAG: MBG domain-containing protein, partial [Clostridia bacterium]|nr:MBG domain-containing protein [Clostridia bacterium]
TYGYEDPQFTYAITSGNLVFGDNLNGRLSREIGETVGLYDITSGTLTNEDNANYDITLAFNQFEIQQRLIVIIADVKEKIYGETDPLLTYGLLGGSMLAGDTLSGDLSRAQGEDTGTYPITIGTLQNHNYEIVIVSGNLIIEPKPITITANAKSFLHGSATSIDLTYEISGGPLAADAELISQAITITSSAKPDSYVGDYPIYLRQVKPLNNYTVTTINSVLKIEKGAITDVSFEDLKVLYDGYEQSIIATGEVSKYTVEYKNNSGTEVGVYRATATFTKENYHELVLEARLIIMTNVVSTSEIIPQGILTIEGGVDPYVVPVIIGNENTEDIKQAEEVITVDEKSGESIKTIMNISLYNNGTNISLEGTAEVRMLIPSTITDLETLRIVYMGQNETYDVAFELDGEYIVFTALQLGDYAFITESHAVTSNDRIAGVLLYVGIGALGVVLVGILITSFSVKRKRHNYSKYI